MPPSCVKFLALMRSSFGEDLVNGDPEVSEGDADVGRVGLRRRQPTSCSCSAHPAVAECGAACPDSDIDVDDDTRQQIVSTMSQEEIADMLSLPAPVAATTSTITSC